MALMNTPLVNFICHPDFAKTSFLLKIISVHFSQLAEVHRDYYGQMKVCFWGKVFNAFYIFTETKTPQTQHFY